jgi:RpiR family glv operon transcriptional regulator
MEIDFYGVIENKIDVLNSNEKKILDYVVTHINDVKNMGIRDLADKMFVSSTTIFRFVKKLEFKGYTEFIDCLKLTSYKIGDTNIPQVVIHDNYHEEYLENIVESIRVLSKNKMKKFIALLQYDPKIYFISTGLCREVALYAMRLFGVYGITTILIDNEIDLISATKTIKNNDLLFVIANNEYSTIASYIERIKSKADVDVVSITASNNNVVQSITDYDFYVFSDYVSLNSVDITSRVSMIAIIELIGISFLKEQSKKG